MRKILGVLNSTFFLLMKTLFVYNIKSLEYVYFIYIFEYNEREKRRFL